MAGAEVGDEVEGEEEDSVGDVEVVDEEEGDLEVETGTFYMACLIIRFRAGNIDCDLDL